MTLFHSFDALTDTKGNSLPGYQVIVRGPGSGPVQPIYADANMTPIYSSSGIVNTALTDNAGNWSFFVAPGTYDLEFRDPNGTYLRTVAGATLFTGQTGPSGPTGPANSTYTTVADLKAAPASNVSYTFAPSSGSEGAVQAGVFLFVAGDFTTADDEVNVIALNAVPIGTGALVRQKASSVGLQLYAGRTRTVYAEAADAVINVRRYGESVGAPNTIASGAIALACADAARVGKTVYLPSIGADYLIDREQLYPTGIVGDGKDITVLRVAESARASFNDNGSNPDGRMAAVRIGQKQSEAGATLSRVPVKGFSVRGLSQRSSRRSSDRAAPNFLGTGILYDEMAANIRAVDVGVQSFDVGILHNNLNGHLHGSGISVNNCWYGVFIERNTGDFRYIDSDLTGQQYSTFGCHGSNKGGANGGGIVGLTLIGTHCGFSPYIFDQFDGNGTLGYSNVVMISSSVEQVGNQVMRFGGLTAGQRRVTNNIYVLIGAHSWTVPGTAEHDAFAIQGDSAHPVQLCALDGLDLLQGGGIEFAADGWIPGTTGYVTRVLEANDVIKDYRGPSLHYVGSGVERLVGTGRGYRQSASIARINDTGSDSRSLATWDLPTQVDGYVDATLKLSCNLYVDPTKAGSQEARMVLLINGVSQGIVARRTINPGTRGANGEQVGGMDFNFEYAFSMARRDRANNVYRVEIQLTNVVGCTVNGDAVEGTATQATLHLINHAVI